MASKNKTGGSSGRWAARASGRTLVLGGALVLGSVVGCDGDAGRGGTTPPPGTPAAVEPPTTLPAPAGESSTTPKPAAAPASQPSTSYLWIREVPDPRKSQADFVPGAAQVDESWTAVQFPRARLRLTQKGDDKLVALLYSDDPKEAISKDWQGDRYYFRMPLPHVPDAAALDNAPYRMSAPLDGEADETTDGVFLKGDRFHLVPVDLSVRFELQGGLVNLYVGGRFKQYDTTDVEAEPRWFHLQGIVQAAVD